MRCERKIIPACFLVVMLLTAIGCTQKADEGESASTPGTEAPVETNAEAAMDATVETAGTGEPVSAAPAVTQGAGLIDVPAEVDLEKPISELQAEAKTMNVESLKATALKYKEAILGQQDRIEALSAKIKEIPMMEALGQEAKSLKTELEDLGTTLTSLKDRFQVYYDTVKEKGGDVSGLGM
jgi:hypothetical protein